MSGSDTSYPSMSLVSWMTPRGETYVLLRADFDDGEFKHVAIVNYDSSPTKVKEENKDG